MSEVLWTVVWKDRQGMPKSAIGLGKAEVIEELRKLKNYLGNLEGVLVFRPHTATPLSDLIGDE